MSTQSNAPPLAEDAAREVINRWSAKGVFRLRNMGEKIFISQITAGSAYTIRLQTHYEQRKVHRASEPFRGGAVDDRGQAPGTWDVPVRRPGAFEERTEAVPIPHTERVQPCPQCAGQRRVSCPRCAGRGRITCPFCGGAGFVEQPVLETGRDGQGNVIPITRTVRRPCHCSGGQVRCSTCSGNGIVTCPECEGMGQVKTFDQILVRFQAASYGEVIDVTPVPDQWLGKLSGEVLVDQKARLIDGCPSAPDEVARKANALLEKSHYTDENQIRVILQALHVERIPLQEVCYKYAGVERRLWICGTEQDLYAPKAPWPRGRLAALVFGIILAVLAVAAVLVWLLTRH
jgi:hypothetical protein